VCLFIEGWVWSADLFTDRKHQAHEIPAMKGWGRARARSVQTTWLLRGLEQVRQTGKGYRPDGDVGKCLCRWLVFGSGGAGEAVVRVVRVG